MDHFYERLFRLRGCFYAADGGAAAGGTPDTPAEAKVLEPEKSESKEPTFDDVLNNKAYRSEYDKRMKAAISDERKKWETAAKAKADEAEKLAKMSEEEKAKHEREQAEKALADREAAVLKRELEAEAKLQLSEKGLPPELSSLLSYADAESCKSSSRRKASVDSKIRVELMGERYGIRDNKGSGRIRRSYSRDNRPLRLADKADKGKACRLDNENIRQGRYKRQDRQADGNGADYHKPEQ